MKGKPQNQKEGDKNESRDSLQSHEAADSA
jgi:hypothetical protein